MDPFSQFLTGPRAQSAFSLRVVMDPPFAIDVQDEAALTVIVPVRGHAWIIAEGALHGLCVQESPRPSVAPPLMWWRIRRAGRPPW